jgi:ABC-type multidrug transport system fused ATPase/permease subunit
MSTEPDEIPGEEDADTWRDRLSRAWHAAEALLSTRLQIFSEEAAEKAAWAGKGALGLGIAAAFGFGATLLLAALFAALFAQLFGNLVLGILAATVLYAAVAAIAGMAGLKALKKVQPTKFPATSEELSRDWTAISEALSAEVSELAELPEDGDIGEQEVEQLERRLRGEPE